MKIGIYGGTFDPIHHGHLITAQYLVELRELDKIIFMPCFLSPHKVGSYSSSPMHRLEMVKLAVSASEAFECSDFEINRNEVSFTHSTLLHFKSIYDEIELVVGYDNLLVFDKWYKPDEIFELANVVVLKRPDKSADGKGNRFFSRAVFVNTPIIEISSTEIRERVSKALPINYLVPQSIKEYIYKNKLYLSDTGK